MFSSDVFSQLVFSLWGKTKTKTKTNKQKKKSQSSHKTFLFFYKFSVCILLFLGTVPFLIFFYSIFIFFINCNGKTVVAFSCRIAGAILLPLVLQ